MYKIYINGTPLFLIPEQKLAEWPPAVPRRLVARYPGKSKFLLHYVDMLEKSDRYEAVTLYSEDYQGLVRDFESLFRIIEAAGGVVFNQSGEVLLIIRHGFWDMPKGKVDDGEETPAAALREVQEETGLEKVMLGELLDVTYHMYRDRRGRRVLKRTWWYRMATEEQTLRPQHEEEIEEALWMSIPSFFAEERPVYGNIRDLLEKIQALE